MIARQAKACWRWSNFLSSAPVAGGKPILRVNLDESSLKMHIAARPGFVVESNPKRRRQLLREGQGPNLGMRRAAATLIAFICDDDAVQAKLPQIFVTNDRLMSLADFAELADRCQGNVSMIRRSSAWVTAVFMTEVVKELARCIETELRVRHVILYLDTCPAHMHTAVLKACASVGLHVHFVPALTTAWLQPLDVLAFGKLKAWALCEMEQQRVASVDGLLTRPGVLGIYLKAVESILCQGSWTKAFDLCGLRSQRSLSKRLSARMRFTEPPVVDSNLPSLADLEAIFPAGATIPTEQLFELVVRASAPPPACVLRLPGRARLPRLML